MSNIRLILERIISFFPVFSRIWESIGISKNGDIRKPWTNGDSPVMAFLFKKNGKNPLNTERIERSNI
ncbi:MAG: hypothetical protein PHY14_00435 [Candidatus Gracilibacteria bacterium]|nr:hypothetical protein [Candidatus Gracilibacteria bacterium]